MTGFWVISYGLLWLVVVALVFLVVGVLRQLAILTSQLQPAPLASAPTTLPLEDDGPLLGSKLPLIKGESINGFGKVDTESQATGRTTLVIFISPRCPTCQTVVAPLNRVSTSSDRRLNVVIVLRAHDGKECDNFLDIFPLQAAVICDSDRAISASLGVDRNPLGLLYNEQGILNRKGVVVGQDDLLALLGDEEASPAAQARILSLALTM